LKNSNNKANIASQHLEKAPDKDSDASSSPRDARVPEKGKFPAFLLVAIIGR